MEGNLTSTSKSGGRGRNHLLAAIWRLL